MLKQLDEVIAEDNAGSDNDMDTTQDGAEGAPDPTEAEDRDTSNFIVVNDNARFHYT